MKRIKNKSNGQIKKKQKDVRVSIYENKFKRYFIHDILQVVFYRINVIQKNCLEPEPSYSLVKFIAIFAVRLKTRVQTSG